MLDTADGNRPRDGPFSSPTLRWGAGFVVETYLRLIPALVAVVVAVTDFVDVGVASWRSG